jgi:hypothetical protein
MELTTLILQSIRASEYRFTLFTGSIAGHICVPDGGGEDAVVPSSPRALSSAAAPPRQRASPADAAVAVSQPSGPVREPDLGKLGDVGFDDPHSLRLKPHPGGALHRFPDRGINVA